MKKNLQQSTIVRFRGDYRIVIPESITRNLADLKPNDYLLFEFKDNSIIISPAEVKRK